jgi:mannose-6-phosphate isomerase-like protein (cupin superfamily)
MNYPNTIRSGGGEEITFLRIVTAPDGSQRLELENAVAPMAGPAMHVHWKQDESLTVIEGKIGIQIRGQEPTYHGPGETATFTAGTFHRFWNAGETTLRCTGAVWPPNNVEYFLTALYASMRSNPKHRPSAFDAAYLLKRYRSEFDMVGIPAFVRRVIFPVLHTIGRFLGKYQKYHDAPEAV